jgi:iron only hydrogenase large subunit-like protein
MLYDVISSGCVTSAEAVLIQNHSHQKLAERLAVSGAYVVVTLSPQSVASIANLLGLAFADCFRVLSTALKACGVRYVFDAASGGDVALLEAREQFVRRYACTCTYVHASYYDEVDCIYFIHIHPISNYVSHVWHILNIIYVCDGDRYKAGIRNLWSAPPYSIAVSSVRESVVMPSGELLTRTYEGEDLAGIGVSSKPAAELPLPMLCSHCPGMLAHS